MGAIHCALLLSFVTTSAAARPGRRGWLQSAYSTSLDKTGGVDNLRVALFITTHLPEQHIQFLDKCWPSIISRSPLLQHAEVIFLTSQSPPEGLLHRVFPDKSVRVEHYSNPGYEEGAMLAMEMATKGRWFEGYDWVVRVNPDVLILEDDFLIKNMLDKNVSGIFADCTDQANTCNNKCESSKVNTDFFAARGSELSPAWFTELPEQFHNAEAQANAAFRSIIQRGEDRWIKGTTQGGICRVRGPGVPVLHDHSVLSKCPLAPGEPRDRGS